MDKPGGVEQQQDEGRGAAADAGDRAHVKAALALGGFRSASRPAPAAAPQTFAKPGAQRPPPKVDAFLSAAPVVAARLKPAPPPVSEPEPKRQPLPHQPKAPPMVADTPANIVTTSRPGPSAEAFARALVAAARVLGEDAAQLADAPLRCRFPALIALAAHFSGWSFDRLGAVLGIVTPGLRVRQSQNTAWWVGDEGAGDRAVEAALDALDALEARP